MKKIKLRFKVESPIQAVSFGMYVLAFAFLIITAGRLLFQAPSKSQVDTSNLRPDLKAAVERYQADPKNSTYTYEQAGDVPSEAKNGLP